MMTHHVCRPSTAVHQESTRERESDREREGRKERRKGRSRERKKVSKEETVGEGGTSWYSRRNRVLL